MANSTSVLTLPGVPIGASVGLVNYVQQGTTTHFDVTYDSSLGAAGVLLADAVLQECEADYSAMVAVFGGAQPNPLPIVIRIDPGFGGASHATCAATELHLQAFNGNNGELANFLDVAELSESFMAAQGMWNCGDSSGEGLSRILATERYPAQLNGFASASSWLNGGRPNWVDNTDYSDRNYPSIGCAALFLNYLRYQLHFTWSHIIAAGSPTLAQTYTKLTKRTDAWKAFTDLVSSRYPDGLPANIIGDNIFPITYPDVAVLTTHWLLMADLIGRHGLFPVHPQPDDKRGVQDLRETLGELKTHITAMETVLARLGRLSK